MAWGGDGGVVEGCRSPSPAAAIAGHSRGRGLCRTRPHPQARGPYPRFRLRRNDRRSRMCPVASCLSRHVRADGEPSSIPPRTNIGIPAFALLAARRRIASAGVNDHDISEDARSEVVDREAANRHGLRGLSKKLLLVDQRPVGI